MATNAERQAAYRARQLKDTSGSGERLSMIVDVNAKKALERLASYYGMTQKAMLELVLTRAEEQTISSVAKLPNSQADYYAGKLRVGIDHAE